MKKCELCGSPVKVVGKTTLHYEPNLPIYKELDRLHKSIIDIACMGTKAKKFKSVPEMRVAMLYKEKETLKLDAKRDTSYIKKLEKQVIGGILGMTGCPS